MNENPLRNLSLSEAEIERLTQWAAEFSVSLAWLADAIRWLFVHNYQERLEAFVQQIEKISQSPEFKAFMDTQNATNDRTRQRSHTDVRRKRRPGKYRWGGPEQ